MKETAFRGRCARRWGGALAGVLVAACATVTPVPLAWKDPDSAGGPVERVFVIGVAENAATRRLFEDRFAEVLAARGVAARPSYLSLPDTDRLSEGRIREAMDAGRFDGVLITRLVGREKETTYVPPRTYTVPRPYYYGYYETHTIVRLETNLYTVADTRLVWTGQSETLDPRSVADGIDSATRAVTRRLAEDGLLP